MGKLMRCTVIVLLAFLFLFHGYRGVSAEEGGSSREASACKTVYECLDKKTDKSDSDDKQQMVQDSSSGVLTVVKMVIALGIVLFLLIYLLKFIQRRTKTFQEGKALQSLAGIGVGANRSIQAVKVGSSVLIVGVGESVTLLKEINEEEEVEKLLRQGPAEMPRLQMKAGEVWSYLFKNRTSTSASTDFSEVMKEQLAEISAEKKSVLKMLGKKGKEDE
ncbi:flagellar biosynthetic protein FliO [Fictibacillus terranigra]|uniref:Flagellar biosynthetic protein FliO n=1 Tax=Fictibacillus terranigra TaxID=3058424 RepID=A0ABT8E691_9BACL|nr:flagellar biosynthetic protein FliO [Fictibacillus sp. CENA-BCM004]MDN4073427.1 flagellar biosynthetic protein FliO [Fictibacillus sp. CENA-BCM004]